MGTYGGAVIAEWARVLDGVGLPVPRLFATEDLAAAPIGTTLLPSGMTSGTAMTVGRLAGATAAAGGDTDEH